MGDDFSSVSRCKYYARPKYNQVIYDYQDYQGFVKRKTVLDAYRIERVWISGLPDYGPDISGGGATWMRVVLPSKAVCITAICKAPSFGMSMVPKQLPIH